MIVAGGLGLLGYFFSLEWRIRNLKNVLLQSEQKNIDSKIVADVLALPDAELDSELAKRLDAIGVATNPVPMPKP